MKNRLYLLTLMLFLIVAGLIGQTKNPIKVIFDTDMGNDIDDALALSMLYFYQKNKDIDILSIMSNKPLTTSVEFIDIMNNYYGFPNIPIGKISEGVQFDPKSNYAKHVSNISSYKRTITDYNSLPESVSLYRKILAKEKDNSVVIISVGFLTNLSLLINSQADQFSELDGIELIKKKVKTLYLMGGEFNGEKKEKEFNIRLDSKASVEVFKKWPNKIIVSPVELGKKILYPGTAIENSFIDDTHPLVVAYKSFKTMPYDRPTWDLTSVLSAVEKVELYFTLSEPGHIWCTEDAYTHFVPCQYGKHYYIDAVNSQENKVENRFIDIIK